MDKNTYIKQLLEDRLLYVENEIRYYKYLLKSYNKTSDTEYDYSDEIKTTKDIIKEYENEKIVIEDILNNKESSFERSITLTKEDVGRFAEVVDKQEQKDMSYEKQNTMGKIKRGKELLETIL